MGDASSSALRLHRVRRTCFQMLEKRDYYVSDADRNMTSAQFIQRFGDEPRREDLTILTVKQASAEEQIFVFFVDDDGKDKISNKVVSIYYERMKAEGVSRAVLVLPVRLGPQAEKALASITEGTSGAIIIETFLEAELMVNITEHKLVPKHEVLSKEDKSQLLRRYKVKETQLPRIQFKDPVARFLGLQRGQIVKITRDSETAGRYITYRVCY